MIDKADVVVIGAGGLGAATAYHLTAGHGLKVALLDGRGIGSQTSPRAAGMVSCLRKCDLLIKLIKDACRRIETFEDETGQRLDWVRSGSLKVTRRLQDASVLDADAERGRRMALEVELISPEEACRLNPFLRSDGVVRALWIGDDRYFDPAQLAVGFATAAAAHGACLLPDTAVVSVNIDGGRVTGVTTNRGVILSPVIVDAAGAWARQVAEASGLRVPLVPTRQQLIVTEPIKGVMAELPMVRIMDAAVYMRPCLGGFLWGVYEEEPQFFDMGSLGPEFDIRDMPLDISVLNAAAADVAAQLPILREAAVRELRGGIPTMTADGHYVLGPSPGIAGFYFASGCNVAGLSIAPTIGALLAGWIVDGSPSIDISPMAVTRFKDAAWSEEQLRQAAAWQYRHFYGAV